MWISITTPLHSCEASHERQRNSCSIVGLMASLRWPFVQRYGRNGGSKNASGVSGHAHCRKPSTNGVVGLYRAT